MDNFLDKLIEADVLIANGIFYFIRRIDCDSQVVYLTTSDDKCDCTVLVSVLEKSHSLHLYNWTEIK